MKYFSGTQNAKYPFVVNEFVEKASQKYSEHPQRESQRHLKREQEIAVKDLLSGKDVLAILPTGFLSGNF